MNYICEIYFKKELQQTKIFENSSIFEIEEFLQNQPISTISNWTFKNNYIKDSTSSQQFTHRSMEGSGGYHHIIIKEI